MIDILLPTVSLLFLNQGSFLSSVFSLHFLAVQSFPSWTINKCFFYTALGMWPPLPCIWACTIYLLHSLILAVTRNLNLKLLLHSTSNWWRLVVLPCIWVSQQHNHKRTQQATFDSCELNYFCQTYSLQ